MFCPRCAKKFDSETSYCRTCGLSLDEVRKFVSGEGDNEPEFQSHPHFGLLKTGIAIFILGMVVALANAALGKASGFNSDVGKAIFLSMLAIGLLLLGLGFVFTQRHYVKRKTSEPKADVTPALATANLQNRLEESRESYIETEFPKDKNELHNFEVASVTEHTTRRLG